MSAHMVILSINTICLHSIMRDDTYTFYCDMDMICIQLKILVRVMSELPMSQELQIKAIP